MGDDLVHLGALCVSRKMSELDPISPPSLRAGSSDGKWTLSL